MSPRLPSPGRATIIDVARAAGVSRQTVSNTLNRPERVAPETLDRVNREIERLGFTPNVTAQQLRRRRASAYGFEVNPSGAARLGHVLDEFLVELTIAAPDHSSHLVTFAPAPEDVLEGYRHMLGTGLVDGFVLAHTRRGDPRPQWLRERAVPFVSFGRIWDSPGFEHWVDVDGRAGVRQAVTHLIEAGYRQVGFLGWPSGSAVGDDRRLGWLDGLAEAGLTASAMVEESNQDLDEATEAAGRLLDRMGQDGAVICASDLLALGALRACRAHGLEPGRDAGVVGFDDTDVAEALQITSIRQPIQAAAAATWRMLHATGSAGIRPVLLSPTLTLRHSTTRARGLPAPSTHTPHPAAAMEATP